MSISTTLFKTENEIFEDKTGYHKAIVNKDKQLCISATLAMIYNEIYSPAMEREKTSGMWMAGHFNSEGKAVIDNTMHNAKWGFEREFNALLQHFPTQAKEINEAVAQLEKYKELVSPEVLLNSKQPETAPVASPSK